MEINQTEFKIADDFFPTKELEQIAIQSNEIYFVGYGINESNYNSFQELDVKGKVVVVLAGEPMPKGKYMFNTEGKSKWSNSSKKIEAIKKYNPSLIVYVDPNYKKYIKYYKQYTS